MIKVLIYSVGFILTAIKVFPYLLKDISNLRREIDGTDILLILVVTTFFSAIWPVTAIAAVVYINILQPAADAINKEKNGR